MSYLILVRHGLSEYNKQGIWAGWEDPELAPEGFEQADKAAETIKDMDFDYGYTSDLIRCTQTLDKIKEVIGRNDLPTIVDKALRERNYGAFNHKNKWDVKKEIGDEEFQKLRRSWDYPPPQGESLKMVYERVVPYYENEILPKLKEGKNILVASSNNALRALVKYLENIPDDEIVNFEIGTGEVYVYEMNPEGKIINKEVRNKNPDKGKV